MPLIERLQPGEFRNGAFLDKINELVDAFNEMMTPALNNTIEDVLLPVPEVRVDFPPSE